MSYSITRRLQFCAGHRVHLHESKCNNMHGHNYVLLFKAEPADGKTLDPLGRVIDFSVLKAELGTWIDDNWDHGFIYKHEDLEVQLALGYVPTQKTYGMNANPTAENMAHYLLHTICPALFEQHGVVITSITLWETENCFAEVTL